MTQPDLPGNESTPQGPPVPQWDLYLKHIGQAWADLQSSSDQFDKSLLTFSSGALALSIAFVKDIVPLREAAFRGLLYWSWLAFGLCIAVTIMSFAFSVQAQKKHMGFLYEFFINCNPKFLNKKSVWSYLVTGCAFLAAGSFLTGLALTLVFAFENVRTIR
jgi:hypothetical protein